LNITRFTPLAVLLAFSLSCGGSTEPDPASTVDRVVITPATLDLEVGATTQLVATPQTAQGATVSGLTITWTSSNEAAATVSAGGLVTGVGIGAFSITAGASGKTGSVSGAVAPGVTIAAAGGTVISADGRVRLVVPAGAVTTPVRISIVPATGLPAHPRLVPGSAYRFSPSGLQFQVPVEVSLTYGALPAAMADGAAYLWLHKWINDDWVPIPGLSPDTLTKTARGQLTSFSDYGAALSELAADLQALQLTLNHLLSNPIASRALEFLSNLTDVLAKQNNPLFQALVPPLLDGMFATACNAYKTAVNVASNTVVDDYRKLGTLLGPVALWEVIVEDMRPNACQPPLSLEDLYTIKIEQFTNFYGGRLDQPDFTTDFGRLLEELGLINQVRVDAQLLGADALEARLVDEVQVPLLDRLRLSAYTACRRDGAHYHLGTLIATAQGTDYATFDDADIRQDLQYCATRIDWRLVETDGTTAGQGNLGGGDAPGAVVREASAPGLATGRLELSGDLRAFKCDGVTLAPDQLSVLLRGVEVKQLTAGAGGNFLASPVALDMAQAVSAAGIDPAAAGVHPLEIQRLTSGCGVVYMSAFDLPVTLATLNLSYPAEWAYQNDFGGTAGPGWSTQQITTAPGGQRFLGVFSNAMVALDQSNLPTHTELVIELDVYVLATMDGNSTEHGPDIIQFELDGAILKATTFSNDNEGELRQAFPGNYPAGDSPAGTGASGINALGYPPDDPGDHYDDTTYRLTFTVPHSATAFRFVVRGSGQEGYPNEGWGIDNIRIIAR
jgi:hypothetical protein